MTYPQIKNLRIMRDFKQEYVAAYLDISQPEYSRLETGTRTARAKEMEKLAQLYGIRIDQLMQSEVAVEVASSITRPFKRSDAIPRDIVDRLIDNNGELLRNLIDHQSKTERIIDKLFTFIERKSGSEVAYREMASMSPVNEEFNNLRTTDK
jgi:transcriptional regulator with XRE-family HTH domain